jgi:hypothetical protein
LAKIVEAQALSLWQNDKELEVQMKIKTRIFIGLLFIILCGAIYLIVPEVMDMISRSASEKSNINLNFVDLNKGDYAFSRACLLNDGSVLIASTILKEPGTVSLIKLSPEMKFIWERKYTEKPVNPGTLLFQHKSTLTISDIQLINEKCYFYAIREKEGIYNPVSISTDLDGNLLNYLTVPYTVSSHTPPKCTIMDKSAFFVWYNDIDKTIILDKISLDNAKITGKTFIYLIQDNLKITSISTDQAKGVVFITTYDSFKGSSLLTYNTLEGLRLINDTDKYQTLQMAAYIDSKLYVVATKDSSLAIGLIHANKDPEKMLSMSFTTDKFMPKVLLKKDEVFYIGIDEQNPKYGQDAVILKYKADNSKAGEFIIRGKFSETLNQLLILPNGEMLAIGNSSSHRFGKGSRVYATKFKL